MNITLRSFFEDEFGGITLQEAVETMKEALEKFGPEARIDTAWVDRDEFADGILTIYRPETEEERAARIEAAVKATEARAIRFQKDCEAQDRATYLQLKARFERNS